MSCKEDELYELKLYAGDEDDVNFRYLREVDGTVIDITGGSAVMTWREYHDGPVVLTKNAIIDGPTGEMAFKLLPADTQSLITSGSKKKFVYDVELTEADGDVTTIVEGTVILKRGVTRP